jgi:hypothetical protein
MTRAGLVGGAALLLLAGAAAAQKPTPNLTLPADVLVRFQTADLDSSGGLTQDEAVKGGFSGSRFGAVDADGDQIVTVAEVGQYLIERARVWSSADRDGDGHVSRAEAEGSEELRSVFNNADADADGIVRQQEHEAWSQTSLYQNVDLPVVVPNIINKKF